MNQFGKKIKEEIMGRLHLTQMRLRQTSVGMIHKFVPPKEVIECGKKLSEKESIKMEERGEKKGKPAKLKRKRK